MAESNRRFLLRSRPAGRITDETFELVEEPVPEIEDGQALVRTQWISLDPTNRATIDMAEWIYGTADWLDPTGMS